MPRFCASCGTQIEDSATVCAKCGTSTAQGSGAAAAPAPAPAAAAPAGGMEDNVAGMLAYITIIPAIIFLVMEPYNKRPFVRFHSFQCLFLAVALFVIHMVLMIVPIIGWLISMLVTIGSVILWVVLLLKAYQGQKFKLPFIGDFAEKQANS